MAKKKLHRLQKERPEQLNHKKINKMEHGGLLDKFSKPLDLLADRREGGEEGERGEKASSRVTQSSSQARNSLGSPEGRKPGQIHAEPRASSSLSSSSSGPSFPPPKPVAASPILVHKNLDLNYLEGSDPAEPIPAPPEICLKTPEEDQSSAESQDPEPQSPFSLQGMIIQENRGSSPLEIRQRRMQHLILTVALVWTVMLLVPIMVTVILDWIHFFRQRKRVPKEPRLEARAEKGLSEAKQSRDQIQKLYNMADTLKLS